MSVAAGDLVETHRGSDASADAREILHLFLLATRWGTPVNMEPHLHGGVDWHALDRLPTPMRAVVGFGIDATRWHLARMTITEGSGDCLSGTTEP